MKNKELLIGVAGLGVGLIYGAISNYRLRESTSKEKLQLFKVCLELSVDNLKLKGEA